MGNGRTGAANSATGGGARKAWLFALIGSPLALLLGGATRAGSAEDVAKPPAATVSTRLNSRPPQDCSNRFLEPLEQLAGHPPSTPADDWAGSVRSSIDTLRSTLPGDAIVDTLIATIPDPVDSGLDYAFDTTLQSLRLGVEHGGNGEGPAYTQLYRDRSWLSWRDFDSTGNARPESAACRETTPGIMVFRNSLPSTPQFRILLFVGETPTRGLHVAAMVNALEAARELTSTALENGARMYASSEIKIIGPTFSGSASSLRFAIEKWAGSATEDKKAIAAKLHIVTGSATGSSLLSTLGPNTGWRSGLTVRFDATTLPAAAVECAYLHATLRADTGSGDAPRHADGREKDGNEPISLSQVAMLHESGTEFGASATPSDRAATKESATPAALSCRFRAGVQISFPVHIASLREAYEEKDRKDVKEKDGVARATSLTVSLREKHPPLDAQSNPSPKTTYAQDVALAGVLAQISVEQVRYVGIQATDIADAIFLARKIRDIAPDVRLAFFEADALLLHPDFQRDLLGALVMGPYPFLGSSHFASNGAPGLRSYVPFENAAAEGTYNAVLASRGWRADELFEYTAPSSGTSPRISLPVWQATIGRSGFVPLSVQRTVDCQHTIYDEGGAKPDPQRLAALCGPLQNRKADDWRAFDDVRKLDLRTDVPLPRLWQFLFGVLGIAFVIDQYRLKKTRRTLADAAMPAELEKGSDQAADLAIGRTKWLLYAAIRSFLFALAFAYLTYVESLSHLALPEYAQSWTTLSAEPRVFAGLVAIGAALTASLHLLGGFAKNYFAFIHAVRASFKRDSLRTSLPDILSLTYSASRRAAARMSCAQLGLVAATAFVLSCAFAYLEHKATFDAANGALALDTDKAVPALTLFVLRTVALGNGVSPAAPALLFLASVYVWATGRMARLAAAHGTSRISPNDRESDLVSTPLRLVLYPSHDPCAPSSEHGAQHPPPADGGFTRVERAAANAIWRPIAGPLYLSCAAAVIAIPLFLFALKPLATIEIREGTWLLRGGLALSTSLIGITLLQLIRYWFALEHLLKRTMGHPLGAALSTARPFVRESVDDQLSRSPNDLLRLAACGPLFDQLEEGALRERVDFSRVAADAPIDFAELRERVNDARNRALYASSVGNPQKTADATAALGQCVIKAAAAVTRVLEHAWQGQGSILPVPESEAVTQRISGAQAVGHDTTHVGGAMHVSTTQPRTSGAMPAATQSLAGPLPSPQVSLGASPNQSSPPPVESREPAAHAHRPSTSEGGADVIDALSPVAWQFGPGELPWLRECQTFVATVVALIVSRYVRQLRYFLYAMTASIALLLLALSSYPFEPHRLLLTCSWCVVGSVVGAGLWIFVEFDRNSVISQLSGTDAGKVTLNGALAVRVFAWVILPLLGVAATTYPDIASRLYSVFEPFVRSLR